MSFWGCKISKFCSNCNTCNKWQHKRIISQIAGQLPVLKHLLILWQLYLGENFEVCFQNLCQRKACPRFPTYFLISDLIRFGALKSLRNGAGETAWDIAKRSDSSDVRIWIHSVRPDFCLMLQQNKMIFPPPGWKGHRRWENIAKGSKCTMSDGAREPIFQILNRGPQHFFELGKNIVHCDVNDITSYSCFGPPLLCFYCFPFSQMILTTYFLTSCTVTPWLRWC